VKQHLYQQMHAQQRSLRNASAMHQSLMTPHLEGLPQAALNPGAYLHGILPSVTHLIGPIPMSLWHACWEIIVHM